jgi:tetratricopeptide (TPR) repeat protein
VIQAAGQFVPIKLNAEKEGVSTAKKYNVHGFPTILFVNAAGEIEGRIGGYMPAEPFTEQLKQISQAHRDFPQLQEDIKAKPDDVVVAGRLVAIYAMRGDAQHAASMIAQAEKADPDNSKGALTKAYNAVGDLYQEQEQFDSAIPYFRKAASTGKDPRDVAYAHLSSAVCYLSQRKNADAIPDLEAVVNAADAPADLKKEAQDLLRQTRGQGQP